MRRDVAPRRRDALVDLQLLVAKGHRRMRQAHVVEAAPARRSARASNAAARRCRGTRSCRARGTRGCAARGSPACSTPRRARTPCSTMRTIVASSGRGSSSSQRLLQRVCVRALLDHAGAFAVVLADDDQRAADRRPATPGSTARRRRRWCRRSTSTSPRRAAGSGSTRRASRPPTPRSRTPRRARRACRGRAGLHHHVEQVRHRRALVAADVRHARLQQRLRDREDALAVEGLRRPRVATARSLR